MSYSINSSNPIEFLNPNRIWKIGHKGHLRELDVSGILNISGNMHFTNQITGYHLDLFGDISFNQNLYVSGNTRFNQNLYVSGNSRFKQTPYQEINPDISYLSVNGPFGLAKDLLPKQDDQSSKNLIKNSNYNYFDLGSENTTDIANSIQLRRLMIIGTNGFYASSKDGLVWDVCGNTSTNELKQIIWVKEQSKFVIIGDNGYVAISSDSSNIDFNITIPAVNTLNSIAWSPQLGMYIIVGMSNSSVAFSATSSDATTWTNNTIFNDVEYFTSIIWIPEINRFIAVGSTSPNGGIDHYPFFISTQDGINWDLSGTLDSNPNSQFFSIAWSSPLCRIVAVGHNGFFASAKVQNDNIIWDFSGNITGIERYYKIIWASHLQRFVAVGNDNPIGHYNSSLDGITWDCSGSIPRVSISICWAEDLGKLFIPDSLGRIYFTSPKYLFQTTYNLFQDTVLQELEVNGDSSFNKNVDIQEHLIVHGGVSLNNRLDISGITTLSDHLLTDSSYVKVPVSFSTFAIAKGTDLLSNITQVYGTWHNLTSDGYSVTINPVSVNSFIKLDFKVNYICSNETDQTISFRVKNNHNEIIFADLSLGTTMGVTNKGIYNGLYIDTSKYSGPVTYNLEYLIANDNSNNIDVSSGVLGHNHGNSNIIIAQELYIPLEIQKTCF